MASTNSYNFTVTRDQLIEDAHKQISAIGEGETPSSSQVTEAARLLNMIVKHRHADGMPLWALKRGTILPTTGVSSIDTNSHVVTAYDSTTILADEAASQTVISVTSSTGMTALDQVGIELDDGSMHWTTIVSVDSAIQITITTGLPSAAGTNNRVYAYTASSDRIQRPIRILEANRLDVSANVTVKVDLEDRADYFALTTRQIEGPPLLIYYDARLGSATADPTSTTTWYGTIYFWPRFADGNTAIEFTYQRPFQDFDAASDNPDFPQEFYLCLMLELAAMLGPKFGLPLDERRDLFVTAKMYRDEALSTVVPEGSLSIQPHMER